MLSVAAFLEGKHSQAFPSFGSERMGAPVMAFCRIDEKEIRLREPVGEPDALIIQDTTLLHQVDLFSGVDAKGYLLINTTRAIADLGIGDFTDRFPPGHVQTVPATELALEHVGRPVPNAALLGGFAAISGEVSLASVEKAIRDKFPGPVGEGNAKAAAAAFHAIESQG